MTTGGLAAADVDGVAGAATVTSSDTAYRPVRAYGTLILLLALYTLSFLDRSILSLLVAPIKAELKLDDVEVSLLIGAAFSIFYAIMGLPLAYLADTWNRRSLVTCGVVLWSAMTASGGVASGFLTMFLSRMGVGLGEAALSPAAYSLLGDIFPKHRLGRAMAIYTIGAPLGLGVALSIGGLVVEAVANIPTINLPLVGEMTVWRTVLVAVGVLGVPLGLLMLLVREPDRLRGRVATMAEGGVAALPYLWSQRRIFGPLFLGLSCITAVTYGTIIWTPTLLSRNFGVPAATAAIPAGIALAVGGVAGMLVGGAWADRLFARGVLDGYIRVLRWSVLAALPFFALMPLTPTLTVAVLFLALATFCQCLQAGLPAATIHLITPNRLRARIFATYFMLNSLIGMGLGPTMIALWSNHVYGEAHLNRAVATTAAILLPVAFLSLHLCRRGYEQAVAKMLEPELGG